MRKQRHQYSAEFKFKVALEAAKGTKTISELASATGVHPTQISQWKRPLLEEGGSLFKQHSAVRQREQAALQADRYAQIGRLKMELEWLKKKADRVS